MSNNAERGCNVMALIHTILLVMDRYDFWFIFGEEIDEAEPIIKKLFSLYEARKSNSLTIINKNSVLREFDPNQKT